MSTKIFSGFIMDQTNTLDKAWAVFSHPDTRQMFENELFRYEANYLAEGISSAWDRRVLNPNCKDTQDQTEYPYSFLRSHFSKTLLPRPLHPIDSASDPDCDEGYNSVEAILFPISYRNRRYVIGIHYCRNPNLEKIFMSIPGISDFSYWNNTDRPREISPSRWKRRQEMWDVAIDKAGETYHKGLSINLTPCSWSRKRPEQDDIIALIPPRRDRALKLARHHLIHEEMGWRMRLMRELDNDFFSRNAFGIAMYLQHDIPRIEEQIQELVSRIEPVLLDFDEVDLSGKKRIQHEV